MDRAFIVTGASSGIGAATAARLANAGAVVFAGVRNDHDCATVGALNSRIRPLLLDVADAHSIAAAADAVSQSGLALHGLVNNAGIALAGPLEFLPMERIRHQFDVNVFGAVAMTQAVLPQLRTTKGRIVFVGSIQGRLTAPFLGPYSASKYALEAITDAFRMELTPFGIGVSIIEPGAVKTPIWKKGAEAKDELVRTMPAQALTYYGDAVEIVAKRAGAEERDGLPADRIATLIEHALCAPKPRARYVVGQPAQLQALIAHLPTRLRDRMIRKAMGLA